MREAMEMSPNIDISDFYHDIFTAASRSRCNEILIEWKRYEDDDCKEIDYGAHRAHCLWST